jgi:hypothetical protein
LAALITRLFSLPTAAPARTPARRVAGGHDERLARRLTTCYNYGHPRYSDCMHARLSGSRHHNGFVILLHPSCGGYIGVFFLLFLPGPYELVLQGTRRRRTTSTTSSRCTPPPLLRRTLHSTCSTPTPPNRLLPLKVRPIARTATRPSLTHRNCMRARWPAGRR